MNIHEIQTRRLLLKPFSESDYDDLFEFLSQLTDDEFEGCPGIAWENGREHLKYRLGSDAFCAMKLMETGKVIGNICCEGRDFYGKGSRVYRQQALSAAGLRRRSPFRGLRHSLCFTLPAASPI